LRGTDGGVADANDGVGLGFDQFRRESWKPLEAGVKAAVVHYKILTLHITMLA
jgi:hypothetical protein